MGVIDINVFTGEIPCLSHKLLPNSGAAKAENCYLEEGNLQPGKAVANISGGGLPNNTKTIFRLKNGTFLSWRKDVDVVRSFAFGDDDRVIFTGDGYPKETIQTLWPSTRRLGISAPDNPLVISLEGEPEGEHKKMLSYVYTRVAIWEDGSQVESAPSPPTGVTEIRAGVTPTLTGFKWSTEAGTFFTHFRIYRLNAGNIGAMYQYVGEIPKSNTSFQDRKTNSELAEPLETMGWTAPRDDLKGLTATSHGLVFGFVKNRIFPSQVFAPYTFPEEYSLTTESDVVGFGYTGSLVVVATETTPYMVIGQQPEAVALRRLGYQQPCVSKKSIVNIPGAVLYASPDGLFAIDESGAGHLATEKVWTKKQWEEMHPENLIGFYYDGAYYGFFEGGKKGFAFDFNKKEVKHYTLSDNVYGGHYSPFDDTLYLIFGYGINRYIVSWGKSDDLQDYTWHSKVFSWPDLHVFTAGKLQGDFTKGETRMKFLVNGEQVEPVRVITSSDIFRIKPKLGETFQIYLNGRATIDRILIASIVIEIANRE